MEATPSRAWHTSSREPPWHHRRHGPTSASAAPPAGVRRRPARRSHGEGPMMTLLGGELPCLVLGAGPPLVVLVGLESDNVPPTGVGLWMERRRWRTLARRRTVHVVRRPAHLPAGVTMHALAALH